MILVFVSNVLVSFLVLGFLIVGHFCLVSGHGLGPILV